MNISIIKHSAIIYLMLVLSACGSSSSVSSGNNWMRQAENPLIVPAISGNTLDYGPADPSVLFDPSDSKWKAWFSSTLKDLTTSNETMTIKYSESPDGVSWSTPVVAFQVSSTSTDWDYTNAETPSVIKNPNPSAPAGEKFMLWYSGANKVADANAGRPTAFPYYQIGLAYSADGKSFTRVMPGLNGNPGLVLSADAALFGASLPGVFGDGLVADPDVIYRNGEFQMWFSSYAETAARSPLAFGISYATSTDGITWSAPHDNPLSSLAKTGDVVAGQQPSVLFNPATSQYEMWFSNDTDAEKATIPCSFNTVLGFWHAVSSDGINWTPDYSKRDLAYETKYHYEWLGFLTGVKVVLDNGTYRAYYSAWGTTQIPDTSAYFCPNQFGGLLSAVLTLNRATLISR